MVSGINTYNGSGIHPAKRNDAPMVVEKPVDRLERRFDEGEGFFELYRVGFMDDHAIAVPL